MHRLPALALVFFAACGPGGAADESTGDTDATTSPTTSTSESTEPTGDTPTDPFTPTGDPAELCGPCDTLLAGNLSPTGDPRIDGAIIAADRLRSAVTVIEGDFDRRMRALADVYGLPFTDPGPDLATQLKTAIQDDFFAHLDGNPRILHEPGRCRSDITVAADAQFRCELAGGCDVTLAPTHPPVQCEGTCFGACAGICDGPRSCAVPAPGSSCSGTCDGVCSSEQPAACDGRCAGECTGNCSQFASNGLCDGRCDGECIGNCDTTTPAPCPGECSGLCLVDPGAAECNDDTACHGACSSGCAGECAGKPIPPSIAPDCAVSAECQLQAAAQGSASMWCAPSTLELHYILRGDLDPGDRGAFITRTAALQTHGLAILQSSSHLQALITGTIDGALVFDPSPLLTVTTTLEQLISLADTFDIPSGRRPCVTPALQAATTALADTVTASNTTLQAQSILTTFLTTGK